MSFGKKNTVRARGDLHKKFWQEFCKTPERDIPDVPFGETPRETLEKSRENLCEKFQKFQKKARVKFLGRNSGKIPKEKYREKLLQKCHHKVQKRFQKELWEKVPNKYREKILHKLLKSL